MSTGKLRDKIYPPGLGPPAPEIKVIDSIVGCDLNRAMSILTQKLGFTPEVSVREWDWKAEDRRTPQQLDFDKNKIILWMLKGWVHKPARYSVLPPRKKFINEESSLYVYENESDE